MPPKPKPAAKPAAKPTAKASVASPAPAKVLEPENGQNDNSPPKPAAKAVPSYMRATAAAKTKQNAEKKEYKDIKNSAAALAMRAVLALRGQQGEAQRAAAEAAALRRAEEEAQRRAELEALMKALREKAAQFTKDKLAGLSVRDLQSLDAATLGVFDKEQMQSLSVEMISNLSVQQIQKLTKEQMMFLKAEQLAALNVDQIGALSEEQLGAFNQQQLTRMPAASLQALQQYAEKRMKAAQGSRPITRGQGQPEGEGADAGMGFMKVWALTKTQLAQLPEDQKQLAKVIDPRDLGKKDQKSRAQQQAKSKAKEVKVKELNAEKISSINPDVIKHLSAEQVKSFSKEQIRALSKEQIEALTEEQLKELPPELTEVLSETKSKRTSDYTARKQRVSGIIVSNLDTKEITKLEPQAVAHLSAAQIQQFSITQINSMSKAQLASFTPEQLAALPDSIRQQAAAKVLGSMSKEQLGSISAAQVASLPPEVQAVLKASVAVKEGALSMASWTPDTFHKLTPAHVAAIEGYQLASLTQDQLQALPASAISHLSMDQLKHLSPAQIAKLSPEQTQMLTPAQLMALSPEHFAALSAEQLTLINPDTLSKLATMLGEAQQEPVPQQGQSSEEFAEEMRRRKKLADFFGVGDGNASSWIGEAGGSWTSVVLEQFTALKEIKEVGAEGVKDWDHAKISSLNQTQVAALQPDQIRNFTEEQLSALNPQAFAKLSADQLKALNPAQLKKLSQEHLKALTPEQVRALSGEQLQSLSPGQVKLLGGEQQKVVEAMAKVRDLGAGVAKLNQAELQGLSQVQVAALTATQLSVLSPAQLACLSPQALSAISASQLAKLEPEQISSFTAVQLASLFGVGEGAGALPGGWASRMDILKNLSREQLASLTLEQLQLFTPEQLTYLTNGAASDPYQAINLYQALLNEELRTLGPRPKKLDLPWRQKESADQVKDENIVVVEDKKDRKDSLAAQIVDEDLFLPSASSAREPRRSLPRRDSLDAEECPEDPRMAALMRPMDMPEDDPASSTSPSAAAGPHSMLDDTPAAECLEELVVLLVDDPADCDFYPEMEVYTPSLNVVDLDRDIEEENFEVFPDEEEPAAMRASGAGQAEAGGTPELEGPPEEPMEDAMPEVRMEEVPKVTPTPDVDKMPADLIEEDPDLRSVMEPQTPPKATTSSALDLDRMVPDQPEEALPEGTDGYGEDEFEVEEKEEAERHRKISGVAEEVDEDEDMPHVPLDASISNKNVSQSKMNFDDDEIDDEIQDEMDFED